MTPSTSVDLERARVDLTVQIGRAYVVDAVGVLDEGGDRREDVSLLGIRIGERCSRFERVRAALLEAHPHREGRVAVEPRGDETDRALVRFLLLRPRER